MNKERVRNKPRLVLSEGDYGQVSKYLEKLSRGVTSQALEDEIDRADVREAKDVPRDAVRLNSRVSFLDLSSGLKREISIVRPESANVEKGFVSFLAPVGSALLGLSAGQQIDWKMPNGKIRSFKVLSVQNERKYEAPLLAA